MKKTFPLELKRPRAHLGMIGNRNDSARSHSQHSLINTFATSP
jgi:hypothetical protein